MGEFILIIAVTAALLSGVTFAIRYDRVRWYRSAEGRNIMSLAASLNLLLFALLVFLLTDEDFIAIPLGITAVTGIAITLVWRTIQLERAQRNRVSITKNKQETK